MIQIKALETDRFSWLFIESRGNKPDRADLLRMEYPDVDGKKGVVISPGKLPLWAAAGIVSHYRNRAAWQAVYDPKERGAIVVFSTSKECAIAGFIPLKFPCLICGKELRADAIYPYCHTHQNHAPERQSYERIKVE